MKKLASLIVLSLIVSALSVAAFAQGKSKAADFTFSEAFVVGEKKFEPGTYRIKFNADKSELEIMKNGDLVATAKVTVDEAAGKSPYNAVSKNATDRGKVVTDVRFGGDRRTFKVSDMNMQSASAEPQL